MILSKNMNDTNYDYNDSDYDNASNCNKYNNNNSDNDNVDENRKKGAEESDWNPVVFILVQGTLNQ